MLLRLIIVVGLATVLSATRYQRSTAVLIRQPNAFADACHPQGHGCECRIPSDIPGKVETLSFDKDCRGAIQELQTAANKKKLNKEIEARFGDFRDGCFPRPSGGCRCNEKNAHGDEVVVNYRNSDECKVQTRQSHVSSPSDTHQTDTFGEACRPSGHGCECRIKSDTDGKMQILHFSTTCKNAAQELRTAANKQKLSEEIKTKFGDFKDGCFPRPSGGCRCNEKNSLGEEVVVTHDKPEECKVPMVGHVSDL
ncbi:hypothetical protein AB6A40_000581 [Gnathostoma spinigerum]|uniref:Uncharacterized protein n=1 Tax=Gnathostoma spinigerum TaxID=75299 RepID=A0ABD6E4G1_9BILA